MTTCNFFNIDYLVKLAGVILVVFINGGQADRLVVHVGRLDVVGRVSLLMTLTLVAVNAFLNTI